MSRRARFAMAENCANNAAMISVCRRYWSFYFGLPAKAEDETRST